MSSLSLISILRVLHLYQLRPYLLSWYHIQYHNSSGKSMLTAKNKVRWSSIMIYFTIEQMAIFNQNSHFPARLHSLALNNLQTIRISDNKKKIKKITLTKLVFSCISCPPLTIAIPKFQNCYFFYNKQLTHSLNPQNLHKLEKSAWHGAIGLRISR